MLSSVGFRSCLSSLAMLVAAPHASNAAPASGLRLIPFPKQVQMQEGHFRLVPDLRLAVTAHAADRFAASLLREELGLSRGAALQESSALDATAVLPHALILFPGSGRPVPEALVLPVVESEEAYALSVTPERVLIGARHVQGLLRGVQTARQLVRANVQGDALPALYVSDWPSLRHRGFQDDITRGPSSLLKTLEREVALGAEMKMNVFTYYMEHQYAFSKHPVIGPEDGSLTPDELRQLVAFAARYGTDIIGCQQSFGHFYHILKHKEYAHLRETGGILCPTVEASYQLLDDLYSEQAPLLPFAMFNVCCDETHGLGRGPSGKRAAEIGVGGVYAGHMRRIHDLLKDKYGKRMMMWGDIILRHPENLAQILTDTVMLTWGYQAAASFEHQITPFAESGYEFLVCPGVSCWNRILPDFACATTNIGNFVRDGAKHGAIGMLNTTWDDDGENFFAPNWHGVLWSAECAWNASTTSPKDFNRRIGGVLFGEPGTHFGQAIELLSRTHSLPGFESMHDRRFWRVAMGDCPVNESASRTQAGELLAIVDAAITHLVEARRDAQTNADLLDYFLFGARRMQLMGQRMEGSLDACRAYARAVEVAADRREALAALDEAGDNIRELRDAHAKLKNDYETLWHRENKPYALQRVQARFDGVLARYEGILQKLLAARVGFAAGTPLPRARSLGLQITELGVRRTRPTEVTSAPMAPDAPWAVPGLDGRIGIRVACGPHDRLQTPVQLQLPAAVASKLGGGSLLELTPDQTMQTPVLYQVDGDPDGAVRTLAFNVGAPFQAGSERSFLFYFGSGFTPTNTSPHAVRCSAAPGGMTLIENDCIRALVGPEGGHIYRWEVKTAANLDLTQPGETGWAGFADMGRDHRSSPNKIEVLAAGPALVQLRCTDATGLQKMTTAFAGVPWIDVTLNAGKGWYWNYDRVETFAPEGPTPGIAVFSDGFRTPVRSAKAGFESQAKRGGVTWSAKSRQDGLLLALLTPEVKSRHAVGPGGGMGGTGIEHSVPAAHFVTYGGVVAEPPEAVLNALQQTMSLRNQPDTALFGTEQREDE